MKPDMDAIRPRMETPANRPSPSEETMGEILNRTLFHDCYERVFADGSKHFAMRNRAGDTEFFLVFSDVDEFEQSTEDRVYFDFQTYERRLLAIIWTLHHPDEPLGFPVPLELAADEDRYMAIRLLEQQRIWIHYLAVESDQGLLHIFSEAVEFPENEKNRVRQLIWDAYHEKPAQEMGKIEDKPAFALDEQDLTESARAYYFDYRRWEKRCGEEAAQVELMELVSQAILLVKRYPNAKAREARMTVWAGESGPDGEERMLGVYISPDPDRWMPKENEDTPLSQILKKPSEYIRNQVTHPLKEGALPIMEYDGGRLYSLQLDETFVKRMEKLFSASYPGMRNPYGSS